MSSIRRIQTASHWGVSEITTDESGAIVGISPSRRDPHPSPLQMQLAAIVRNGNRIDQPYVSASYLAGGRRKPRGSDSFVPVDWDAALDLVAEALTRTRRQYGNEAIYGGSYGWASAGRFHHSPSQLKRFLGLAGGFVDKVGNHSFGAALGIMPYIIGRSDIPQLVASWSSIVRETRLLVLFGGAHTKNTQIGAGGAVVHPSDSWLRKAHQAGTRFVSISPSRSDLTEAIDFEWLRIRPNTDAALMLGLAHVLVTENLYDRDFVERYCAGFDQFRSYVTGACDGTAKDIRWASHITGIPSEQIASLARRMVTTRTMVAASWSVQRADHGEQPIWMTVALAALIGQIGLPGGGFSIGLGATSGSGVPNSPNRPKPTLPLGHNPVSRYVPVARVTDMLLNAREEFDYNGQKLKFPDVRLIYSVGGNPFHHNCDLNRFLAGWQRPDTIVVHEPWWTPAAKHADIVLPATTPMERNDILATDADRFYVAMRKVIDPVGQSRNDHDIFADLAGRLGFQDAFTEGRDEFGWLRHMYALARSELAATGQQIPDFDRFWEAGLVEFAIPDRPSVLLEAFRGDPRGNPLRTPSGRIELFSSTIAAFGYADCPPHPAWIEPAEWLGSPIAKRFPIHLLSNQPATRLHSQLDPAPLSRSSKIGGREPISISRSDADSRNISHGDTVRVFNDRGAFLAAAVIVEDLLPNVATIATGAWYDPDRPGVPGTLEKHGNPNVVTMSKGTSSLAQGPAAQTALVEIEKFSGAAFVTAFEKPSFASKEHPESSARQK